MMPVSQIYSINDAVELLKKQFDWFTKELLFEHIKQGNLIISLPINSEPVFVCCYNKYAKAQISREVHQIAGHTGLSNVEGLFGSNGSSVYGYDTYQASIPHTAIEKKLFGLGGLASLSTTHSRELIYIGCCTLVDGLYTLSSREFRLLVCSRNDFSGFLDKTRFSQYPLLVNWSGDLPDDWKESFNDAWSSQEDYEPYEEFITGFFLYSTSVTLADLRIASANMEAFLLFIQQNNSPHLSQSVNLQDLSSDKVDSYQRTKEENFEENIHSELKGAVHLKEEPKHELSAGSYITRSSLVIPDEVLANNFQSVARKRRSKLIPELLQLATMEVADGNGYTAFIKLLREDHSSLSEIKYNKGAAARDVYLDNDKVKYSIEVCGSLQKKEIRIKSLERYFTEARRK